jgi:hypothetical protein
MLLFVVASKEVEFWGLKDLVTQKGEKNYLPAADGPNPTPVKRKTSYWSDQQSMKDQLIDPQKYPTTAA